MERRVIVDRFQREADIGQHALDHPAEGRVFVAHMGDHAFALEIVVLDGEVGPALDVALAEALNAMVAMRRGAGPEYSRPVRRAMEFLRKDWAELLGDPDLNRLFLGGVGQQGGAAAPA